MRGFLSALWQSGKNKPGVGRQRRRARHESKGFASRMAHQESRPSHSATGRFCYNQSTESGAPTPRSHGVARLPGSAPALPNEKGEAERGDTQAMRSTTEHDPIKHPLARIITFGEFAIERLVPAPSGALDEPPRYARVPRSEWSNRGPAMALLKVLLCRANRRASRDELIEAIWPDHEAINAAHALDSAASVLRRHILRTGEVGSLLLTLRSGGEKIFKLAGQQRLWVDADALLSLLSKALRAQCQGQNPLPLLEEAYALAGGEFLEDDLYAEWAQPRRHTINGARHRVLFKLVDLYLQDERVGLAEELLFAALEEDPADEDALCRLMILLVEQERRQEALHLYQYTQDVLQEEQAEPAVYTRELARRIRQGLVLRERGERYTAERGQTLSLVRQDEASRDLGEGFGLKRARLTITAVPGRGLTPSSYRYLPLRRRSRRQAAHPIG